MQFHSRCAGVQACRLAGLQVAGLQVCNIAGSQVCRFAGVQLAACSLQLAVGSYKQTACSLQRAVCILLLATCSLQLAACSLRLAACSLQLAILQFKAFSSKLAVCRLAGLQACRLASLQVCRLAICSLQLALLLASHCCSWGHPQPPRGHGHWCTVSVNWDPQVCRHGQDAMTTKRQSPAAPLLFLVYAQCAGSCVGTIGGFHRHIKIFLHK